MKVKNLLMTMAAGVLLSVSSLFAQPQQGEISEICEWAYEPASGGNIDTGTTEGYARFSWETLPNGNIQISIFPHEANVDADNAWKNAAFRGSKGLTADGGWTITTSEGTKGLADYFNAPVISADGRSISLVTKGITIPSGTTIQYTGTIEYKTDGGGGNGNDLYPTITFPTYTYGLNCTGVYATKLPAPTNVSIDTDNVLTFDEVDGADEYIVTISIGSFVIKTQTIAGPGEMLSIPLNGEASVTVKASDSSGTNAASDSSDAATWTVSNPDATDLPFSKYCEANIGTLTVSISTADNGDIEVLAHNPNTWRGGGVKPTGWLVAGMGGLLEEVSNGLENPQVFRPKAGISIPKGTLISYNAGGGNAIEWEPNNGYVEAGTPIADYVYGSDCSAPQLEIPADLALGEGNALTFTADENAASTEVQIVSGETTLLTIANFTSGSTVNFPINGTFGIKARSISSVPEFLSSEWSESLPLVVDLPDAKVENSEYCKEPINPTGAGSAGADGTGPGYGNDDPAGDTALFTWETNEDGNIVVTIAGIEGNTTTKFRTLPEGNLIVGGVPGATLFSAALANDNTQVIYTPVAGISIPRGTTITLNGVVPYQTANPSDETGLDNLWPTISFSYTYGSGCDVIEPTIVCENVAVSEATHEGATVTIPAEKGTYSLSIVLVDAREVAEEDKLEDIVFEYSEENSYVIEGLEAETDYIFNVYAIDAMDNATAVCEGAIEFATLAITNPVIACDEVVVVEDSETGQGATITVPVTAGTYDIESIVLVDAAAEPTLEDIVLVYNSEDNQYVIEGLEAGTEYTFSVKAITVAEEGAAGYESELCEDKITFTTTEIVDPEIACADIEVVEGSETYEGATIVVPVTKGTFDIVSIVLVDAAGELENITLPYSEENSYVIEGLEAETEYVFNVKAIDSEDVATALCETAIEFTTAGTPNPWGACNEEDRTSVFTDLTASARIVWSDDASAVWNNTTGEATFTIAQANEDAWSNQFALDLSSAVTLNKNKEYFVSFDLEADAVLNDVFMKIQKDGEAYNDYYIEIPDQEGAANVANEAKTFSITTRPSAQSPETFEVNLILFRFASAPAGTTIKVSNITVCELGTVGIPATIIDKEVINEQYFTIDGRQVAVPTTGIYIVKKTFIDGSVTTEKKLVK